MRKRVVLIFTVDILLILIAIAIYNPFLKLNLNGEEEIEVAFGNYYQDEGITASYFDDDLSNQVTIQNDINLSTIGTYEIKYTLKRGPALRVQKRVIKVVDKEKPVITLKGDLEYPLCGREYIEQGYQASDNVAGNITKNVKDGIAARAGHSEHQTGLAFDVGSGLESFGNTAAGKWLETNCHKYGFIIRYPKYKELITGYNYEPWHIRYVGIEVATEIMENNLTLEEFLGVVI